MLASIRHFLRFIDVDSTFDKYGFVQKVSLVSSKTVQTTGTEASRTERRSFQTHTSKTGGL